MGFLKKLFGEMSGVNKRIVYSFNKQIDSMVGGAELLNMLCQHLQGLGINCTLLEYGNPEGILTPQWTLGCVKVNGQNIDLIHAQCILKGADGPISNIFLYNYVVQVAVKGIEEKLKTDLKPIVRQTETLKKETEVTGFQWVGRDLADVLSKDSNLNQMIVHLGLGGLKIRVEKRSGGYYNPYRRMSDMPKVTGDWRAVLITPVSPLVSRALAEGGLKDLRDVGREDLPTLEAFEVYDKIASTIRKVVQAT